MLQVLEKCAFESGAVAQQRIEAFQDIVLPRIESIEKNFVSFSDPAFQVLYKKAQISAACSGRELDYGMLSELIAHRINNKDNIKKKASIEKAVEIIDKIDEDALCGLTMMHVMSQFCPVSGSISQGLLVINNLYSKIQYIDLPCDKTDWMDNLDILGAARIQSVTSFKKFSEYIMGSWDGYVCCGIKKESPQYELAINKLKEVGLPDDFLIDNELLDGYVRIPVVNKEKIDELQLLVQIDGITTQSSILLSEQQKTVVAEIFEMYDKTPALVKTTQEAFKNKLRSYEAIEKAHVWWDHLKPYFQITSIGRAIAQANAKRIDQSLPDLD